MCIRRIVFAHAKSIYDIETPFYSQLGIKYLLLDLDNTLDSYRIYYQTLRAINLINDFKGSVNTSNIQLSLSPIYCAIHTGLNKP